MAKSLTYFFTYDAVNEAAYVARTREEIIAAADTIRCTRFSELRGKDPYPVALYRKNDTGDWIRTPGNPPPDPPQQCPEWPSCGPEDLPF